MIVMKIFESSPLCTDSSQERRTLKDEYRHSKSIIPVHCVRNDKRTCKRVFIGQKHAWSGTYAKSVACTLMLMGFIFAITGSIFNMSIHHSNIHSNLPTRKKEVKNGTTHAKELEVEMYDRLLTLASNAPAQREFKQESSILWREPNGEASSWKPCADKGTSMDSNQGKTSNGFLLISANGGLNQQRVAICNAVSVASILNATLILPKFLYSNVWKDPSQFGDIYEEDHFMMTMQHDVDITKGLPAHLRSLDMEEVGSLITDSDIPKEAKLEDYISRVLPRLIQNRVVHLLGFGNRLGFDPVPQNLQRLRCKCNFHALRFVPRIREAASLIVNRLRKFNGVRNTIDENLLGHFIADVPLQNKARKSMKYLALHLRFEKDMVAYSLCDFGGGEDEWKDLRAYREEHFPLLIERLRKSRPYTPEDLRKLGKCPLTPEQAGLVLAGLGFNRGTYIYLAGSDLYGGKRRMNPFTRLYPYLVKKEDILTPSELAPFRNFSSQLAALDFIVCAAADVFAMSDTGSQLSSLVSGYRTYYGEGRAPTFRPNKKVLAAILSESSTISWKKFEELVKKMIQEDQIPHVRELNQSVYRHPRCLECMCISPT